jgi:hypothetical protein
MTPAGDVEARTLRRAFPAAAPREDSLNFRTLVSRRAAALVFALGGLLGAVPARAGAHVEVGSRLEDATLDAVAGGRQPIFGKADVHVLVFFKPGQDRSLDTLKQLASCEKTLAAKPVRLVGLVSSSSPRDEVRAFVRQTGVTMPVLVDEGDQLYGKLEIRQHPVAIVVDQAHRITAVQPYARLNFCEVVLAQVQLALKEITPEQLAAVVSPGKAPMPSDDKAAVAARHVRLGERYLASGSCALAAKQFDEALALDPSSARAAEGKKKVAGCGAAPAAK